MRFVLATANPGKIREMSSTLSGLGIEVMTRSELGVDADIEETGSTFLENALLKANAICRMTGLPAIADDTGLVVDGLGGEPGLYSSSYGGEHLDDNGRCSYLIKKMNSMEQRSAKFVCTIVCVFPDGSAVSAEGECSGRILTEKRGEGGFGYDPIFLVDGTDKTFAELSPEEKDALSHRGKAIREFIRKLEASDISWGASDW